MRYKKMPLSAIFDMYAFRIFCDSVDTCYRVLGVVHNLYKPIPGKFKDYIAIPKANGYQSLHTVLMGPYGSPIEIQIRTHDMHRMAESGIAAHWLYKSEDKNHQLLCANQWLQELLEIQKSAGDSLEFIDNLKVDLFPQEIFVFSPKGDIITVPRDATIIDFAYAVHTDIGNACVSAKIDKQLVPLQTKLENGVTVEIITAEWARPNAQWLNYVTTAKARSSIRSYLKHAKQQEALSVGQQLLEKELNSMNLALDAIAPQRIQALLKIVGLNTLDALLEDIGLGNKMAFLIAKQLTQDDIHAKIKLNDNEHDSAQKTPLIIKGTEGMVITLAKCCHPIPGDSIIGFFNPGKGIVVHLHDCRNRADISKKQNTWLDVEWSNSVKGDFPVELRLEILNQRGALATIASVISEQNCNIENITVVEQDESMCVDLIIFTVKDRIHLANVMRRLKELPIILKLTRVKA
jgi:RelA/SpoT family (p)ppGpp synthetase